MFRFSYNTLTVHSLPSQPFVSYNLTQFGGFHRFFWAANINGFILSADSPLFYGVFGVLFYHSVASHLVLACCNKLLPVALNCVCQYFSPGFLDMGRNQRQLAYLPLKFAAILVFKAVSWTRLNYYPLWRIFPKAT